MVIVATTMTICVVPPPTTPALWETVYDSLVEYLGRPPTWDWSRLVLTGGRLARWTRSPAPHDLGDLPLRVEVSSPEELMAALGAWPEAKWSYRQTSQPSILLTLPNGARITCSYDRSPVRHLPYPTGPDSPPPSPVLRPPAEYSLPAEACPADVADLMASGVRYTYAEGILVEGHPPLPAPEGLTLREWVEMELSGYRGTLPADPEWERLAELLKALAD